MFPVTLIPILCGRFCDIFKVLPSVSVYCGGQLLKKDPKSSKPNWLAKNLSTVCTITVIVTILTERIASHTNNMIRNPSERITTTNQVQSRKRTMTMER